MVDNETRRPEKSGRGLAGLGRGWLIGIAGASLPLLVLAAFLASGPAPQVAAQSACEQERAVIEGEERIFALSTQELIDFCLIIEKQTSPSGSSQDFDFELDGDFFLNSDFSLEDNEEEDLALSEFQSGEVTEDVPSGWTLVDIECDGANLEFDEDLEDATVTVTIDGTGAPTGRCVFYNEEDGEPSPTPSPTNTPTVTETPTATATPGNPNVGAIFAGVGGRRDTPTPVVVAPPIAPPSTGDGALK